MNAYTYPVAPTCTVAVTVNSDFKKTAAHVILAIFVFCLVYIMLTVAALALAVVATYYGVVLMISFPRWISIVIGIGMIATGISLLYFLIKFVASVSESPHKGAMEIHEHDHPALFAFLRSVAAETQTPFPKKVFLTHDVNAAVFYDSSVLSMFLPIRKNLLIGVGLVNVVNVSEFKAIIAHEFGHFSQRSMKVGSFTYSVNRVMYNMLYENSTYSNFLQTWGSFGVLSLFAAATVKISVFIQWILRGMYRFVNLHYNALSREMEFHADAIAASVAGGNNLVSALARLQIADACYDKTIEHANVLVNEKKRIDNIYLSHSLVYRQSAEQFNIPIENGVPQVSYEHADAGIKRRIVVEDQWASHPPLAARKQKLDQLNINVAPQPVSAWCLFEHPGKVQQSLTASLYEAVQFDAPPAIVDPASYESWLQTRRYNFRLPAEYNGFYDGKLLTLPEVEMPATDVSTSLSFENIFTEENGKLHLHIANLERDLGLLRAVRDKQFKVKSFDFDGDRYNSREAAKVIERLEAELSALQDELATLERQAYHFFLENCEQPDILIRRYADFFDLRKRRIRLGATVEEIYDVISKLSGTVTMEDAIVAAQRLKEIDGTTIKPLLADYLRPENDILRDADDVYKMAAAFHGKDYHYFAIDSFLDNEIQELCSVSEHVLAILDRRLSNSYRAVLEYQLAAIGKRAARQKQFVEA